MIVAALSTVPVSGCGASGSPTSPSATLTGVWTGSIADFVSGTAALRLELSGDAGSRRGTWSVTSAAAGGSLTETVQGRVSDTTFFFDVGCPTQRAGAFTLQRDGNNLRGTYFVTCASLTTGTISLSR